jgi:methylthioribose-1-phosphate isomerase
VAIEPIRWKGDRLELLDQRLLPDQTVYVTCRTAAEVAAAIRDMVVRGAPAIGCAAAFGVVLGGKDSFELLAESRPTAVNLFWALERMKRSKNPQAEALAIFKEDLAANRAMGAHGAALMPKGARILTYCNTGALATSGHGTALGVIRSSFEKDKSITVIACETRPYLQGARLTAWECVQEGIPCTLITDNMAGHMMARGEVDAVIVGADRIAANGDTANKIGTYMVAVLARRHGLPFYVAAPTSTFDQKTADGSAIQIEERPGQEVTGYRGVRWAPEGVKVRNPAFDVTPAELITAIVCEKGVMLEPNRERVLAMLK